MSARASEPGGFRGVALSPDGARAVASRTNPLDSTKADLWLFDLSQGSGAARLPLGAGIAEFPVWSPDGKRIAFMFNNSSLRQKLASGEGDEEELLRSISAGALWANSWSPDGRFLLYATFAHRALGHGDSRPLVLPAQPEPVPFIRDARGSTKTRAASHRMGDGLPTSRTSPACAEVYVRGFTTDFSSGSASTGGTVLVSRGGGTAPRWRGDGREIFYLAPNGKMMAVEVTPARSSGPGRPWPLFQTPAGTILGDVTADGKRFLLVTPVGPSASVPFTVVLNWTASLKK